MTPNDIAVEVAKAMAARPQQEGITAREYAASRKIGVQRARDELRMVQAAGKLRVIRVLRPNLVEEMRPVPAYVLVGKGK